MSAENQALPVSMANGVQIPVPSVEEENRLLRGRIMALEEQLAKTTADRDSFRQWLETYLWDRETKNPEDWHKILDEPKIDSATMRQWVQEQVRQQ